jgi:hypothetical protein
MYSFIAVPSRRKPYFLLPDERQSNRLAATRIYQPHKLAPRVGKRVLVGAMKLGWNGCGCPRVLLASKGTLPLTALLREITGEPQHFFALSFGRQAAVRKLTIQVMRPGGEIVGYIKLPLTEAAAGRVRNEARMLQKLSKVPALTPYVPRLLYAGDWFGSYLLFQSPLEGTPGPVTFDQMHEAFLEKLRNVHRVDIPLRVFADVLAAKWEKTAGRLGSDWDGLAQAVLRTSILCEQGKTLHCGIMHGDFAPWNTRVRQSELLLFDWESANWESPVRWDYFHFHVQAGFFFAKDKRVIAPRHEPSERTSFLFFLLSSVCRFLEEANFRAIAHHKKLLQTVLQETR